MLMLFGLWLGSEKDAIFYGGGAFLVGVRRSIFSGVSERKFGIGQGVGN